MQNTLKQYDDGAYGKMMKEKIWYLFEASAKLKSQSKT